MGPPSSAAVYTAEIDAEFVSLIQCTADLAGPINLAGDLNESGLEALLNEVKFLWARWTRFTEAGFFTPVSEPFADALALIAGGIARRDGDRIHLGLLQIQQNARDVVSKG